MEMKWNGYHKLIAGGVCFVLCVLLHLSAVAQSPKYSIRNGRMWIELSKQLPDKELEEFVLHFELADLDLKTFLKTNKTDSLEKLGWAIEKNTKTLLLISKPLLSFDLLGPSLEKIILAGKPPILSADGFPPDQARVAYGFNKFRGKYTPQFNDSSAVFFLKDNGQAGKVLLAGSFTDWQQGAVEMTRTDSGWIAPVKLSAGKHWYKFIVDANWITDPANSLNENDGDGNINSVFFKPNTSFHLDGFTNAKRVYVTGSFNNWREKDIELKRSPAGWHLPLYLAEGTHTYKFIVDGNWYADPANPDKLPDGHGAHNSVLRFGRPHLFKLDGFLNAQRVVLSGSFNGWKEDELFLAKTANGWELPYVIGPGNYEYKFIVDKQWMSDPANSITGDNGNSFLVIQPNYTFTLEMANAKKVYLAGDFNNWDPKSIPMKREGDRWIYHVHLAPGKHRYKFIVDGKWIKDPANKLWEENEFDTGNSVLWIER
jgi:hypothetical protein